MRSQPTGTAKSPQDRPGVGAHEVVVRHKFDRWSISSMYDHLRSWLAYVQEQVLEQVEWSQEPRVLDVACGGGHAVRESARRLRKGGKGLACGCDISIGMLRDEGRLNAALDGSLLSCASAQSLPYRSGIFDVVVCTAAFHHFPAPLEALREFSRVLRPGGTVLIAETCRDLSVGTWMWDRLHRWFERGHVKYYRVDEMRALLEQTGLEPVSWHVLRPSYARTRKFVRTAVIFSAPTRS